MYQKSLNLLSNTLQLYKNISGTESNLMTPRDVGYVNIGKAYV